MTQCFPVLSYIQMNSSWCFVNYNIFFSVPRSLSTISVHPNGTLLRVSNSDTGKRSRSNLQHVWGIMLCERCSSCSTKQEGETLGKLLLWSTLQRDWRLLCGSWHLVSFFAIIFSTLTCPEMHVNEIYLPHNRHYKASSLMKFHQNTQRYIYQMWSIWKCLNPSGTWSTLCWDGCSGWIQCD